jgi:hypothetical protein
MGTQFFRVAILCRFLTASLMFCCGAASALAQAVSYEHPEEPSGKAKIKPGKEITTLDAGYTAKMREFTTEPFLTTDLVDHLPASSKVPTPQKILGYVIGTPDKLTHTADIYRYYRALADASPRVKMWVTGKSEEGRDFVLVAVSSETNLQALDHYKQITAQLADPRKLTEATAQQLIHDGKPFYWLSGSIHSPETGSPEMLMELAYRLAVEDTALIQNIRNNVIVLITPVLEVDGRDRAVDLYNYRKANPDKPVPNLVYWGHYVAHDNNRDAIGMALALSRNQMHTFLEWHPQVLHDLHESVPFLYTSTGMGPYNAWLDPIVVSEWQELAYYEIQKMTERGVPGIWTHGFYDGWAPNYMFFVAQGHNAVGRFYETFGGRGADTGERTVPADSTSRTWFRPNPPLPKIRWSIRDNINLQESALLFALDYTSQHGSEFLARFYEKSRRSVAKATTEGPAAWVIVNDGRRPVLAAQLAELLQNLGAEVHRLDGELTVKAAEPKPEAKAAEAKGKEESPAGGKAVDGKAEKPEKTEKSEKPEKPEKKEPQTVRLPAGSYVLRMDQPYSRMADMLLDTQYYSTNDPRPYDDTGWTLGPLRNVNTVRVTDAAILKAPMTLVSAPARATGSLAGADNAKNYIVDATAEPAVAMLRFRMKDVAMSAAEDAFEVDGKKFHAGALVIPATGGDLRGRLDAAARELSLKVEAVAGDISVARHPVGVPRIALVHTWVNTQNEGWFRLMLDEWKVPYSYISDEKVRKTEDLRAQFDVILLPPGPPEVARMLRGMPRRTLPDGSDSGGAIPWVKSDITPSFGDSPDQTPDVRGGLGLEGAAHLQKFVEQGGVLIPVGGSVALPIELGISEGVSVAPTRQLQARGAILNADVADKKSPIAYGYDDHLGVYFNQAPVLRVSLSAGLGGFGPPPGEQEGRTSGRGSLTDPDIPQGRPWTPAAPEPKRSKVEQETYIDPELRELLRAMILPAQLWPRVVLRFAPEKSLWASGMLAGGAELAETPAVVDVPVGRGHVVLFAINPMWRQETQGSFMLVLNAALHFDHLNAGWKPPAEAPAPAASKSAAGGEE